MDDLIAETIKRIEQKIESCLQATERNYLLLDIGNIVGTIQTLSELEVVDEQVLQGYLGQIKHMISLIELDIIDV